MSAGHGSLPPLPPQWYGPLACMKNVNKTLGKLRFLSSEASKCTEYK